MADVVGKIMAATGNYIKDGAEKTSWSKCGILLKTDKGFRIKMETFPIGGDGWFMVFEEDNQSQSGGSAQKRSPAPSGTSVGTDEKMPF